MAQGAHNNFAVPDVIQTSPAAHYMNRAGRRTDRWNGSPHNGIITANTTGTMKTIDRNGKIAVLGATFKGINDVIKHAVSSKAKNGVYVGEDSMAYPCFDDEDYANENRRFWNFVCRQQGRHAAKAGSAEKGARNEGELQQAVRTIRTNGLLGRRLQRQSAPCRKIKPRAPVNAGNKKGRAPMAQPFL